MSNLLEFVRALGMPIKATVIVRKLSSFQIFIGFSND